MLGPRGSHFEDDDVAESIDDEDLRSDAISQIDITVSDSCFPTTETLTNGARKIGAPCSFLQGVCNAQYEPLYEFSGAAEWRRDVGGAEGRQREVTHYRIEFCFYSRLSRLT